MTKESWKKIPHDERYEVSNYGRVRHGEKVLAVRKVARYYSGHQIKGKNLYDHRLVAELFIGSIPEKYVVHHKNGDKLDNHVSNLEICTPTENVYYTTQPIWCATQTKLDIFGEGRVS